MSISYLDSNIFYPGSASATAAHGACWDLDPSTGATCFCPNYFDMWGTAGASTTLQLNFSAPPAVGGSGGSAVTAGTYLKVYVDGAAPVFTEINTLTSATLASGLAAGNHYLRVWVCQCNTNQWSNSLATQVLNWQTVTATSGSWSTIPVTSPSGLALIYGDSIMSGSLIWAPSTTPSQDTSLSFAMALARALGVAAAFAVYPGIGYLTGTRQGGGYWPGSTYEIPGFFTPSSPSNSSWNQLCGLSGYTRSWPSNLRYVLIPGLGVNDALSNLGPTISGSGETAAQLEASVSGFLAAIRGQVPAACEIVVMPPWAGAWNGLTLNSWAALEGAIQTGWSNYQASTPDPLCYFIPWNLSTLEQSENYNTSAVATTYTSEGLHPNLTGHEFLTSVAVKQVLAAISPGPPVIVKNTNQYFYNEMEP